jgi:TonB family protein
MKAMRRTLAIALAAATWIALTSGVTASEELNRAKELYRSASYDEALSLLEGLPSGAEAAEIAEAREYRALCLVALDRRDDAKNVMTELITADPTYAMSETEASPRVRAMFTEVRRGLLPSVIQRVYADAKQLFDTKDPRATAAFDHVLLLLRDPDVAGNASLGDLTTIAVGFRDLSRAMASVPPPAPARPTTPAAAPRTAAASAPVVAAVAISQALPAPQLREEREWDGEIEVSIDAGGKVTDARMTKPIHPIYDQQLIRAAMNWTYRPAQRDGVAMPFVKVITIHVDTRPECTIRSTRNCREVTNDR